MNPPLIYVVEEPEEGMRLDKYLSNQEELPTRSYLQKILSQGNVLKNGKAAKGKEKLLSGDQISIILPDVQPLTVLPEEIPLDILYEDHDLLVVNKPKGMVVHPAPGHYTGTLVNALLFHCKDSLSGINGVLRPGIVHRIDRDTTGLLVVCKNDKAHQSLALQLKDHTITRKYRGICLGVIKEDGVVNAPIGRHPIDRKKMSIHAKNGREAVTHYHVLETFQNRYTYIECQLETGRTHQIRVHLASIGHPLLGDEIYGTGKDPLNKRCNGQALHAMVLGFVHPETKEYMEFEAPLPEYFDNLLTILRK